MISAGNGMRRSASEEGKRGVGRTEEGVQGKKGEGKGAVPHLSSRSGKDDERSRTGLSHRLLAASCQIEGCALCGFEAESLGTHQQEA
jgi:hypothetical protein